jgi:hypothetical protein
MTAGHPGEAVAGGVCSLEVRWIVPGRLEAAVSRWFARFPAGLESREDAYLLDPHLPGLSVKIRADRALEVKVYRGSPGSLEAAGRAHGRLESWQKWSFSCDPPRRESGGPAGWTTVHKRRQVSRFPLASATARAHSPQPADEPGCEVELVEIGARGQAWWSLAFEATGPASLLRSELEAAAALVFAQALPGGVELGTAGSSSYEEWLRR